jgi:hypothetical protein
MTESSASSKRKVTPKAKSDVQHAAQVQAQRPQQPGESRGSLQRPLKETFHAGQRPGRRQLARRFLGFGAQAAS